MTGILAAIDATLQERCACGCDQPLDPDGPSAWFASERCQARWARHRAALPQQRPASVVSVVGVDGSPYPPIPATVTRIEFDTEDATRWLAEHGDAPSGTIVVPEAGWYEFTWTMPSGSAASLLGPGPYEPGTVLCVDTGTSTEQMVTGHSTGAVTEVYPYRPSRWRRLLRRLGWRRNR